jgi:ribonuclease BN (tRNA processing enzyme)
MSQSKISTKIIQFKSHKGLSLTGYSRASHRTGLQVVGLDVLLDAGLDVQKSFSNVFITHQHLDHVIFLPQYTMNNDNKMIMNVISTTPILKSVQKYLTSALRLSYSIQDETMGKTTNETMGKTILTKAHIKMVSISSTSPYEFFNGKERWVVESIRCYHGIDCVGFGFSVEKIKLKEEYSGLNGKDIKRIKDEQIQITYKKMEPVFIFLGDTNKQIITDEKIYKYPTIIIECTYIYDEDILLAKKNHHIHWNEIKDIIKEKESIQFILIHFSMKYKTESIQSFFTEQNIKNVEILI